MKSDRALAYVAFATVCFVWGTTYLAIRVAIETIPPLLLTGLRFTIAGLVLWAIGAMRGERLPRQPRIWLHAVIAGVLLICIGNFAVVWAEQWVPSGMAALLVATAPFWAALIELFRGQEKVGLQRGIGMLIGFVGVALLVTPRGPDGAWDVHFLLGAAAIQIGCLAWQYGSIHGKHELKSISPLMSSTLQMLAGGIILDVAGLAAGELPRFHVNTRTLFALIYLTIFGSIIAYSAYIYALSKLRATNVSLYAYVNPVVAVILGWMILNEQLTPMSFVAMIVILGGVALVQSARNDAPKAVAAVAEEATRNAA
ncbi:MAG: DMT(drug/metabolite transporter) superfamily permease [Acidobacteria bacterium]|nr:DMT(drug/metabolite transporter) superfamily permease [Acidobacteriota bacterium]